MSSRDTTKAFSSLYRDTKKKKKLRESEKGKIQSEKKISITTLLYIFQRIKLLFQVLHETPNRHDSNFCAALTIKMENIIFIRTLLKDCPFCDWKEYFHSCLFGGRWRAMIKTSKAIVK